MASLIQRFIAFVLRKADAWRASSYTGLAHLRHFVKHSPSPIAIFDRSGSPVAVSSLWRADFSHRRLDDDGMPRSWSTAHKIVLGGHSTITRVDQQPSDNGIRYFRSSIHPWFDMQGQIAGTLIFAEDITDQQSSAANLQRLINNIPDLCWIADSEGRILWCNKRWQDYTGMSAGTLSHALRKHAHHPDVRSQFQARWQESLESGTEFRMEVAVRNSGGEYGNFSALVAPLPCGDGEPSLWFAIYSNAPDQSKSEEHKRAYLLMLAHELRNPLNAIVNGVSVLQRHVSADADDMATDLIDRQVRHMSQMINNILQAAEISKGSIALDRTKICGSVIIANAIESVCAKIERAGLMLHVAEPRGDCVHDGDEVRMTQVITNLLTNAIKYTEPGGHIYVECADEGNDVTYRVRDTGCGIEPAELEHIFDTFYQSDRSLARSKGGMGLGLNLSKNIVDLHGGDIDIISRVNEGTSFIIRIPKHHTDVCARVKNEKN